MTEFSYPWDGESPGDAGPYTSAQWAAAWRALFQGALAGQYNTGVIPRTGDGINAPLKVDVTSPATNQVRVYTGSALVAGRFYNSDAIELVTIAANSDPNPRIDRIVLRTIFADQTIRIVRLQGTPAASPSAPTLTQNNVIFDIPLAQVAVPSGFLTISTGVTDERTYPVTPTSQGGTGISSLLNPFVKGDLLLGASAELLSILAIGATDGMRLAVDSSQTLGLKWVNSRPSIVANNSGGANVTIINTNAVFDTIVSDGPGNISSINGSGYVIPVAGTYKIRGSLSWTHSSTVGTAIGQLSLYDNNAAATVTDVTGASVLSNGANLLNGVVGGGTAEIPEHVCTFNGTEQLSFRVISGYSTQTFMRRTKNPILVLERLY